MLKVATIQMCSTKNIDENIRQASELINAAAKSGAQLIATPEMSNFVVSTKDDLLSRATIEDNDRALIAFRQLAKNLSVYLQIGSLAILATDGKCYNRSFLIDDKGGIAARYDKIHLFDADLVEGESYKESGSYCAGNQAVLARLPYATLGMSICYDLRFPALYTELAKAGAEIISIPAAFTQTTGQAHWQVLTRARAIETGCFIIASAQVGRHEDGRTTYGHSMIISPWGEVLAMAGDEEVGFICADIDLLEVQKTRQKIPNLQHQKTFTRP